jgi:Uma2 family endonuclease
MATGPRTTGLTYDDLVGFPDDDLRREIIGGELFVTPSPIRRHQRAVARLVHLFVDHCQRHGGETYPAPMDVVFSDSDVVEPDVILIRGDNIARMSVEPRYVATPPDLVVEVSSPGTRSVDLLRKKDLYERSGVAEYWFVDLDSDRIEVYVLSGGRYGAPAVAERGAVIESPTVPGLRVPVDDVLGPPDDSRERPQLP